MVKRSMRYLYVEGGGDHNPSLSSECRQAFRNGEAFGIDVANARHGP